MDAVTVRRWIDAPPARVWDRLVDLDALVVGDPTLDLVDGDGRLHLGAAVVLNRRRGHRSVDLRLRVLACVPPARLEATVATAHSCWLIHLQVDPCGVAGSDLHLRAQLDPTATPGAVMRGLTRPLDRGVAGDVSALLASWARQASTAGRTGVRPVRQRIAPGR